ncbi:MAG: actin-binding WH2 domain-containing protein [Armatimonadota bacterium]|nr:actin-binding WH2 domain-containing protein [Armatimonadota bacterium]MDW8143588.1 actin-binding WH2 domain-containing protein [Armatimonadota bacterium]
MNAKVVSLPEEAWLPSRFMETILRYPDAFFEELAEGKMVGALIGRLFGFSMLLLAFYGLLMGLFGGWVQSLASLIKMPLLFLATLGICLPSLYIFNLVLGSKLQLGQMTALLLYAICVTAAIATSLAPVAFFFMICGSDYHFMVLLHVAILAVSGLIGLGKMVRGLNFLCDLVGSRGTEGIFRIWMLLYGIVGAQMGWLMRPFLGSPNLPFQIFRPVEGNFFVAVLKAIAELLK